MLDLHGKANVFGELACLVLLFILKSGMIYRDKSEENKALARLIYADIIYIVNEIVWQFMNGKEFAFDVELNYISNILTNVFIANLGLMYYRYLYFVMTGRKAKGFMVYIPAMILCFFAISTVKTGWFFYITPENVYTRGKYYHSCYLFSYSYIAIITIQAIRRVLKEKNEYLRRRFIIVASFAICPVLFSVAQAFMPGLALIPYGITLAIVSVFVRLQKQSITASIEHQKISRENIIRYRNTVLSNAIQYMVVNLSKNIIEEITVPADDSISLETIIQSGKISSNNYHEMVKYWNENIIGISDKENQMLFQSDVLIDRYWGGETLISEEIQVRKKDGSVGWIKQDFVIAKNQYTGDILATMTTYDITKEKRYEKAYDEQRTIIEALAFGTTSYWIFDIETEEMIGFHADDEEIEKTIRPILEKYKYSEAIGILTNHLTGKSAQTQGLKYYEIATIRKKLQQHRQYTIPEELYYEKKDCYIQMVYTGLEYMDRKAFVISTRDITETYMAERRMRKDLEEALLKADMASKAKSTFLFNMSHDIRTPMNAIIGFNHIAKQNIDNKEKTLDALSKAETASKHMLNIVNDVLEMARIENGRIEIEENVVVTEDLLKNTEEIFKASAEEKGIQFIINNECRTQAFMGDSVRIMQIISNLVSNAIKFTMPGGKIWLSFFERIETKEQINLEIHIKDTGVGIAKENQTRIFDAFEREKSATNSGVQGTGLGLAIAKNLALLMGGELSFTSELGKGSEFVFSFSARPVSEQFNQGNENNNLDINFEGKRILLVEDNELNREIAKSIFTSLGFIVDEAYNGCEAISILSKEDAYCYEIIFMDIQMPVMDGYTTTQSIRALDNPRIANIPIIAMTANAFEEDKKKARKAGMNGHVAKPIDVNELKCAIVDIYGHNM